MSSARSALENTKVHELVPKFGSASEEQRGEACGAPGVDVRDDVVDEDRPNRVDVEPAYCQLERPLVGLGPPRLPGQLDGLEQLEFRCQRKRQWIRLR